MGVQVAKKQGNQSAGTVKSPSPNLTSKIRHGRAINAVGSYLRSSLRVPIIYLEPKLKVGSSSIDVLAVDAAGSGDIHAVEAKIPNNFVTSLPNLKAYLSALRAFPSHYKWLVLPDTSATQRLSTHTSLFASNGLGRVGILLVAEDAERSDLPQVTALVRAERFRVPADDLVSIERFIEKHKPDIEVRV